MTQTNYIQETDILEIIFKKFDTPIVKKLSNGVEIDLDKDYNLVSIILPNFCRMIHRQYPPNTIFQYERAIFTDKYKAVLIIQINNQPIQVRIDLRELDK